MLNIKLCELKAQESGRMEKIWLEISNKIREVTGEVSEYKVFSISYLAYLAADNQLKDTKNLIKFVDENLDGVRRMFIEENIDDLWGLAVRLGDTYLKESLAAVVLWHPLSVNRNRSGGILETPESIVKLAVRLLEGTDGDVADFCCGCGSFLLEALNQRIGSSYFGIETNPSEREVAAIRMDMVSDKTEIKMESVLEMDSSRRFDKIFCDFPWGAKNGYRLADKENVAGLLGMIPELYKTATLDWFFITNVAYHLNDEGRAVVVVPNSAMLNGGYNAIIRKELIELGLVEAVISLPADLYKNTSVTQSLLVLSRNNKYVRMIDAGLMASAGRRQNVLSDEAIVNIISLMDRDDYNSVRASFHEVIRCNYMMNPSRYFRTGIVIKNPVLFEEVIRKMTRGSRLTASELDQLVSDTPTNIQYLMISGIQDGIISGELPYLKELDDRLEKYCLKNNSLLITKSGLPVKVAVASVQEGQKILASANLYVIELDEAKVNPYFLKVYFESAGGINALTSIMVGAAIPSIPVDSLRTIEIPLPPMDEQNIIAEKYVSKMNTVIKLKDRLAKEIKELKDIYKITET